MSGGEIKTYRFLLLIATSCLAVWLGFNAERRSLASQGPLKENTATKEDPCEFYHSTSFNNVNRHLGFKFLIAAVKYFSNSSYLAGHVSVGKTVRERTIIINGNLTLRCNIYAETITITDESHIQFDGGELHAADITLGGEFSITPPEGYWKIRLIPSLIIQALNPLKGTFSSKQETINFTQLDYGVMVSSPRNQERCFHEHPSQRNK